jgi:hypothetical protein
VSTADGSSGSSKTMMSAYPPGAEDVVVDVIVVVVADVDVVTNAITNVDAFVDVDADIAALRTTISRKIMSR